MCVCVCVCVCACVCVYVCVNRSFYKGVSEVTEIVIAEQSVLQSMDNEIMKKSPSYAKFLSMNDRYILNINRWILNF